MKFFLLIINILLLSTPLLAQNTAIEFDGHSKFIEVPNHLTEDIRTIEFWFKSKEHIDANNQRLIGLFTRDINLDNNNEAIIAFNSSNIPNSGAITFRVFRTYLDYDKVETNLKNWSANEWYHIAVVIDESLGMLIFVNGKLENRNPTYTSPIPNSSYNYTIGSWGSPLTFAFKDQPNRYFNGCIDDLHVSKKAKYTSDFEPSCITRVSDESTLMFSFNETDSTKILNSIDNTTFNVSDLQRVRNNICPLNNTIDYGSNCSTTEIIYDTLYTTIYDTVLYSANDTLILNPTIITSMGNSKTYAVKVYPNPAQTSIIIDCSDTELSNEQLFYEIISATGTIMKSNVLIKNQQENIEDLSKGIYTLRITNENKNIKAFKKILIN